MFDAFGFLSILDSREKAILLWLLAFTGWALSRADIRESLGGVIRAFLAPKLLLLFVSTAVYSACVVYAAHLLGLWHTTSVKETIYWFVGGALVFVGDATHAVGDPAYFKRVLRRALQLTIVIEFVVNFYVLPLALELLLVPFVALLVGMSVVSGRDAKLDPARKVVDRTLVALGLVVFAFATTSAVGDLDGIFGAESAEALLVAPVLTLALLPFLYAIGLLSAYEQVFMRIDFFVGEDRRLALQSKRAIFGACRLSLSRVGRFSERSMVSLGAIRGEGDLAIAPGESKTERIIGRVC